MRKLSHSNPNLDDVLHEGNEHLAFGKTLDADTELTRLKTFARQIVEWNEAHAKTALLMTPAEIKQSELALDDIISNFRNEVTL